MIQEFALLFLRSTFGFGIKLGIPLIQCLFRSGFDAEIGQRQSKLLNCNVHTGTSGFCFGPFIFRGRQCDFGSFSFGDVRITLDVPSPLGNQMFVLVQKGLKAFWVRTGFGVGNLMQDELCIMLFCLRVLEHKEKDLVTDRNDAGDLCAAHA